MTTREFHSRVPLWLSVLLAVTSIYLLVAFSGTYREPGVYGKVVLASALYVLAFFLHALWRRVRFPALEVTDESVFVGGMFGWFSQRMSVPLADVAEVLPESGTKIAFRMRSGEVKELPLIEVRPADRADARHAIEAVLAARASR